SKKLNKLFIGTLQGLNIYDFKTKQVDYYSTQADSEQYRLVHNFIWTIYLDSSDKLWMNHDLGVSVLDLNTKKLKHIDFFNDEGHEYSSKVTNMLSFDLDNYLWVGTESGLIRYDTEKDSICHKFTIHDGLENAYIYGVMVANNND